MNHREKERGGLPIEYHGKQIRLDLKALVAITEVINSTTHGSYDLGVSRTIVDIMLIEAMKGGGISGGGIGNVPIKVESFKRPTPTFS